MFTSVLVVGFSHGTVVLKELEVPFLEAAFAAPAIIVLPAHLGVFKLFLIVVASFAWDQGTVDSLLLGETVGILLSLDGENTFKHGRGRKSPARTAVALVLNAVHSLCLLRVAIGSPIDLRWNVSSGAAEMVHG